MYNTVKSNLEVRNMKYSYRPRGVCARLFEFEIDDGKIKQLSITGGCDGNLKGISRLVQDMPVDEVISKLEGLSCGFKSTSCPDQISKALKQFKAEQT